MRFNVRQHSVAWVFLLQGLLVWGCQGNPRGFDGQVYPVAGLTRSVTDIQVRRAETKISLTNTSARAYGPGTVWINGAYSLAIDGFAIGQTLHLDLHQFHNRFSESFRAGGFFATERPDDLLLAELEVSGEMIGLIVIGQDNP